MVRILFGNMISSGTEVIRVYPGGTSTVKSVPSEMVGYPPWPKEISIGSVSESTKSQSSVQ